MRFAPNYLKQWNWMEAEWRITVLVFGFMCDEQVVQTVSGHTSGHSGELCVCVSSLEELWQIRADLRSNRSAPRWVAWGERKDRDAALAALTAGPTQEIHHVYVSNMIRAAKWDTSNKTNKQKQSVRTEKSGARYIKEHTQKQNVGTVFSQHKPVSVRWGTWTPHVFFRPSGHVHWNRCSRLERKIKVTGHHTK